ncbi:MAG: hypothetical protein ABEJ91_02430 [Candidatus Nanohaloarchaea archaeon]
MRKTLAVSAVLLLFASSTAAVVGHNNSGGDVSITGSSGASGSTAAGPNGTEWTAKVSMVKRTQYINGTGRLGDVNRSGQESIRTSWTGWISAPTPCHVIDHEVKEKNGKYVINIKTVRDELDRDRACAQVISGIMYSASFEAGKPYTLEIRHDGETMDTINQEEQEPVHRDESGFISKLLNWLSRLF